MNERTRILRRPTRQVDVGGVRIGGDAPIVVQSMTNTDTADVDATVAQVRALADAGLGARARDGQHDGGRRRGARDPRAARRRRAAGCR